MDTTIHDAAQTATQTATRLSKAVDKAYIQLTAMIGTPGMFLMLMWVGIASGVSSLIQGLPSGIAASLACFALAFATYRKRSD